MLALLDYVVLLALGSNEGYDIQNLNWFDDSFLLFFFFLSLKHEFFFLVFFPQSIVCC